MQSKCLNSHHDEEIFEVLEPHRLVMGSGTRKSETRRKNPTFLVPEPINSDVVGKPKPDFFGTRTHHYADKYLGLHQLPLQHNIRTLCEHNQSNQIIRDGILVTEDFFYIQQRIKI